MELVAELVPPRDPERLLRVAGSLSEYYDWIDVPDAPMGKPNYNSPIVSTFLAAHGYKVIAHLRVVDVNVIALKTITKTAGSLGVKRIVYLRGDPPTQGGPVHQVTPEQAVSYALSRPEAPEPGLLVSLRKPMEAIKERLQVGARFYLALNYTRDPEATRKLEAILSVGSKVYVYYILQTGEEKYVDEGRLPARLEGYINALPEGVSGLLISYPRSMEIVARVGRLIREGIGL